jgi:hypothetical protein
VEERRKRQRIHVRNSRKHQFQYKLEGFSIVQKLQMSSPNPSPNSLDEGDPSGDKGFIGRAARDNPVAERSSILSTLSLSFLTTQKRCPSSR